MKEKKKRPFVIRRSGWSAFSVIAYLLFGIAAPVALIAVSLLANEGMLKLAGNMNMAEIAPVFLLAGAGLFIVSFAVVWVKVHNARKTKYHFQGNVVILENGKVFSDMMENKRFVFAPGMSVHMEQSFKGWFFRYGTIVISMGMATAGEFRMENVKRPKKVHKYIAEYLTKYAYTPDYMSKPYFSHPYAPANMFPHFFGGMFGMGCGCNGNGECGCGGAGCNHGASYPYSSPYSFNGTSYPFNF